MLKDASTNKNKKKAPISYSKYSRACHLTTKFLVLFIVIFVFITAKTLLIIIVECRLIWIRLHIANYKHLAYCCMDRYHIKLITL